MNTAACKSSESYLSMSKLIRKAVQVHSLRLDNYRREEVYITVEQVMIPNRRFKRYRWC